MSWIEIVIGIIVGVVIVGLLAFLVAYVAERDKSPLIIRIIEWCMDKGEELAERKNNK